MVIGGEWSSVPQEPFDVQVSDLDGQLVVAVHGAIDLVTGPVLSELLAEAIDEVSPQVVVLNLTEVPFIDSTALAVFVRVFKRLRRSIGKAGRAHALATASSLLRRLFFVRSSSNR